MIPPTQATTESHNLMSISFPCVHQRGRLTNQIAHPFIQRSKEVTSTFRVYRPAAGGAPGYEVLPKHNFKATQDVSIMLDIYFEELLKDTGEGKGLIEDIGAAADGADDMMGKRRCTFEPQDDTVYRMEGEPPAELDEGVDWTGVRSAIHNRGDNFEELTRERKVNSILSSISNRIDNSPPVLTSQWPNPHSCPSLPLNVDCSGHGRGPIDTSGLEEDF